MARNQNYLTADFLFTLVEQACVHMAPARASAMVAEISTTSCMYHIFVDLESGCPSTMLTMPVFDRDLRCMRMAILQSEIGKDVRGNVYFDKIAESTDMDTIELVEALLRGDEISDRYALTLSAKLDRGKKADLANGYFSNNV